MINQQPLEESKVKTEEGEKGSTICKCCSLKCEKKFFFILIHFIRIVSPFTNITTNIVVKRIFYSLIPIRGDFLDSLENKPDVY